MQQMKGENAWRLRGCLFLPLRQEAMKSVLGENALRGCFLATKALRKGAEYLCSCLSPGKYFFLSLWPLYLHDGKS
jgi:hypothetical protein